MTDLRQAAQQALEALIDAANVLSAPMFADAAAVLRTALEQQAPFSPEAINTTQTAWRMGYEAAKAEQQAEPVAWMTINEYGEEDDIHYENPEGHLLEGWTYKPLYTHPPTVQPEQEPLEYWNAVEGWIKIAEVREHFDSVGCGTIYKTAGENRIPLYTTPPQRPWVGLTPEEILDLFDVNNVYGSKWIEFARTVESKLKEKNT